MRVIILFLPLVFIGRWLFGLPGLFAASTISNLVLGLAAYLWLGRHINFSRR
jgi:Na+-driven multidrug efflux pump